MPLVLPLLEQIVAGQPRKPKPIHDSFQSIVDKFNANIVDADVNAAANISGTKLADSTILTAKIADGQVTTSKLQTSTGAADGVTTIKIADLAVTKPKIAAASVTSDKLVMTIHVVAFTIVAGVFTGVTDSIDGGLVVSVATATVNPTSTFAKATYDLVACYIKNPVVGAAGAGGVMSVTAGDSGTDWTGQVRVVRDRLTTGSATGSAVYVFMQKV
jgi:hypothetical protein